MIKNFEDTYKKFVDQLINFEKNKPCKEEVIIVGLDKGMKMDIYIFMQLCYNIVKQHKQDYIEFKDGSKIYKNQLKKITYYLNLNYVISDAPLCYLEYEYKDIKQDNIYSDDIYAVKIPSRISLFINSDIVI